MVTSDTQSDCHSSARRDTSFPRKYYVNIKRLRSFHDERGKIRGRGWTAPLSA
jgi:hypothetical protein